MNKTRIGVIGATGYAGVELIRLLLSHPYAEVTAVSSVSFEGQKLSDIYPAFYQRMDAVLTDADSVIAQSDVIFASLPHGLSEDIAEKVLAQGKKLIDFGADFRLKEESVYQTWYGKPFAHPALHDKAIYALPEWNRAEIPGHDLIANPGCYPTSIALALMPALKNNLIETEGLVIDSKSGITGSGRSLTQTTHFPDANECFSAYKAGAHRHTPEIEQTLSAMAGKEIRVTFVPHLLPVNRGIESSVYARMKDGVTMEQIRCCYEKAYENEFFVRVLPAGSYANLGRVRMSNFCDLSLHEDAHTRTLLISSVIDNMVKGAAGQAVQNMNLIMGWEETSGLTAVAPSF